MGKCVSPRSVKNPQSGSFMLVRCGKCAGCFEHYVSSWITRLEIHSRVFNYSSFVTLTYRDETRPQNVSRSDVQKMFKRVRKHYPSNLNLSYVLISEYTPENGYPHYHFLSWSDYLIDYNDYWQNGFVCQEDIIPQRIAYVLSYHILKNDNIPPGCDTNFRLMSKHLGLKGFEKYELVNAKNNDWLYLVNNSLQISPLHRYYRKKYGISLENMVTPSPFPSFSTKEEVDEYNKIIDYSLFLYKRKKFRKKFNIL